MTKLPPHATPLPGTREYGPAAAHEVFQVQRRLLDVLERHAYHRVLTPSFGRPEPSVGHAHDHGRLQMVDPASGEVVALRADVTPQVARLVARQLGPEDAPYRLCYSGLVFRPEARHGIKPREIHQTGAELVGASGAESDAEIIALCVACLRALGLGEATLALGHGGILRDLVSRAADGDAERAALIRDACARRAVSDIRRLLGVQKLTEFFERVLLGVGGVELLAGLAAELAAELAEGEARAALESLLATYDAVRRRVPDASIVVDLAAERGLDYYTGVSFVALSRGAGRPLASGGRYDGLLGRYGCPMPALGFGLDEEAVLEALHASGAAAVLPRRDVLVVGRSPAARELAAELRGLDRPASVVESLTPDVWEGLDAAGLARRMARRSFRLVVFVADDGALTMAVGGPIAGPDEAGDRGAERRSVGRGDVLDVLRDNADAGAMT